MFGSRKRAEAQRERERQQLRSRYEALQQRGAELYKRVAGLHHMDRAELPAAVLLLLKEAQHQIGMIRQSIADRTTYEYIGEPDTSVGDLATWTADGLGDVMRENVTNPQTVFEAMSDQFPKVHFTVEWPEAISLVAAEIRLHRLLGILEGLELAGYQIPKTP